MMTTACRAGARVLRDALASASHVPPTQATAPLPRRAAPAGDQPPRYASDALENSLLAFQRAVDLGYGYLETDVRATSDGVLVVFHDATLDRVTDRSGRVAQLPWREVRRARIAGREPVPTLAECLDALPQARFNVDVKSDDAVTPLVEALRRSGALDRVCVASFSDRRLAVVRRALGPAVATSLGPAAVTAMRAASRTPLLDALTPPHGICAQVPERLGPLRVVDRRFLARAHASGLQVHV